LDSPKTPKSFTGETYKTVKINSESVVFKVEKMAENIAKIDEKIREKIKDQCEAIKAINQSLKNSKLKIEKIADIVGFLQEQETNGNWVSKWLAKNRAEK
jgi:type II secretory pathway component PulM